MDAEIINFPRIHDPRGDLTPVEYPAALPFPIGRVYWLYNVPCDSERGGHSHKACHECLVAISGSFEVVLDDGRGNKRSVTLARPYQGLHIPPGIWRELREFTAGAVCLVMASLPFDEADYVRSYPDFLASRGPGDEPGGASK